MRLSIGRAIAGRAIRGVAATLTVAVLIATPVVALSGDRAPQPATTRLTTETEPAQHQHRDGHPACRGIANAIARVSDNSARHASDGEAMVALKAVAEKLGCDLAAVAEHRPGRWKNDVDGRPPHPLGKERGPKGRPAQSDGRPADHPQGKQHGWAGKCDRIAAKLDAAEGRGDAGAAGAFARQAARWGCDES